MTANLSLRGLEKVYARGAGLAGLSLDVDAGELFVVLGQAGSGKTTLLRLIAGLETPSAGVIRVDGVDLAGRPAGGPSAWCFKTRPCSPISRPPRTWPMASAARPIPKRADWYGVPSRWSVSTAPRSSGPRCSAMRSAGCWPSPARSREGPGCCCSTILLPALSAPPTTPCSPASSRSSARPGSPWCWRPTIRIPPSRPRTAPWCWTRATSIRSAAPRICACARLRATWPVTSAASTCSKASSRVCPRSRCQTSGVSSVPSPGKGAIRSSSASRRRGSSSPTACRRGPRWPYGHAGRSSRAAPAGCCSKPGTVGRSSRPLPRSGPARRRRAVGHLGPRRHGGSQELAA
ncbi:MAG: ATP-binding cassette domain-containing protein [Alphaproteobacteria bacterium]|nr:ATP-binding cassette domain-containing protein [Alphaproteobacteria bacterium]